MLDTVVNHLQSYLIISICELVAVILIFVLKLSYEKKIKLSYVSELNIYIHNIRNINTLYNKHLSV